MTRFLFIGACLALMTAGEAAAQSPLPESGSWFITASLPDGGGNDAGIWRVIGAKTSLGIEIDYRYSSTTDENSTQQLGPDAINRDRRFVVGPSIKRYLRVRDRIGAYLRGSFGVGWRDIELERPRTGIIERDTKDVQEILRAAIGADWFPFDGVAIGAFTGIVGVHSTLEVQISNAGSVKRTTWTWNTFRSGIELQYYF
jgi:hypothetical protein